MFLMSVLDNVVASLFLCVLFRHIQIFYGTIASKYIEDTIMYPSLRVDGRGRETAEKETEEIRRGKVGSTKQIYGTRRSLQPHEYSVFVRKITGGRAKKSLASRAKPNELPRSKLTGYLPSRTAKAAL
jgi:hypothetical protein